MRSRTRKRHAIRGLLSLFAQGLFYEPGIGVNDAQPRSSNAKDASGNPMGPQATTFRAGDALGLDWAYRVLYAVSKDCSVERSMGNSKVRKPIPIIAVLTLPRPGR